MSNFTINKNIIYAYPDVDPLRDDIPNNTIIMPIEKILSVSNIHRLENDDGLDEYLFHVYASEHLFLPIKDTNLNTILQQYNEIINAVERFHNQGITIAKPRKFNK
jgi:hypothetical protein